MLPGDLTGAQRALLPQARLCHGDGNRCARRAAYLGYEQAATKGVKGAIIESMKGPPNQTLHLTGAAILVSRGIKQRLRQVSLVV